jgi:hypothetical protein
MHAHPIDWPMWLENRGRDLRQPAKMFAQPDRDGRCHCHLCGQSVAAWKRAEHHLAHMVDLDEWQAREGKSTGPKPDSVRRSRDRASRRRESAEQAKAFGKDSYLYAVDRVEEDRIGRIRPVARRRRRHPKEETIGRVKELRALGRMPQAIADELRLTLNYTRRLIRLIEAEEVGNAGL